MFEEILNGEVGESGGGVCLLVFEPVDLLDRRVNVRLPCDPCCLSE